MAAVGANASVSAGASSAVLAVGRSVAGGTVGQGVGGYGQFSLKLHELASVEGAAVVEGSGEGAALDLVSFGLSRLSA